MLLIPVRARSRRSCQFRTASEDPAGSRRSTSPFHDRTSPIAIHDPTSQRPRIAWIYAVGPPKYVESFYRVPTRVWHPRFAPDNNRALIKILVERMCPPCKWIPVQVFRVAAGAPAQRDARPIRSIVLFFSTLRSTSLDLLLSP